MDVNSIWKEPSVQVTETSAEKDHKNIKMIIELLKSVCLSSNTVGVRKYSILMLTVVIFTFLRMFHWCLKQNKCLELELLSNFLFEPWASDSSVGWLRLVSEICCLLHPAHSWHVTPPGLSIPPSAEPQHANKAPLQPPILKYNRAGARGCSFSAQSSNHGNNPTEGIFQI